MHNNLFANLFLLSVLFVGCISAKKNLLNDNITIVSREAWNAIEPKTFKKHEPVRITIHHEGTKLELADDAAKQIRNV